jgi:hypothetical protein
MLSLWNPHLFTMAIMSLYAINSVQYLIRGYYGASAYWAFALGLTFVAMRGFAR